jgi:YkoY family integral membrane protein
MDFSLVLEYGWVLLVLIGLEGLLSADNALVMAIMVKHLPENLRKKALFYGLGGAFVFRFTSLFIISFLVGVWQVQAIGAVYLMYLTFNHIFKRFFKPNQEENQEHSLKNRGSGFWLTVLKVELTDIAFAVDSILAAVALALTLSNTSLPNIGGLDGGKFLVIFCGGFIGLIIMRFAATAFVNLLQKKPGLETAAYLIVGWVGIKLAVFTLAHPKLAVLSEHFPESIEFKLVFWTVLIAIALLGWFFTKDESKEHVFNN